MTVGKPEFQTLFVARSVAPAFSLLYCLIATQASPGQTLNERDFTVSTRVQEILDDTGDCLKNDDFDCARASLNNFPEGDLSEIEQYRYWLLMGRIEFLEGNYPEAIKTFRIIADLAPSPGARKDYMRYIAQLYASMGQFQQAYDTLEELMVQDGLVPLARRHLTNDALWRGFDIYATGDRELVELVPDLPEFPAQATTQGLRNGYVDLEFTVTRNGSTRDVQIIESSNLVFEESAIEAAEKFRYKPKLVDGKPVETVIQYRVEFKAEVSD